MKKTACICLNEKTSLGGKIMKGKKLLSVILCCLFLISIPAGSGIGNANTPQVLRIGSLQETSGPNMSTGSAALAGYMFAVETINAAGGVEIGGTTYILELIQYDTMSRADMAQSLAERLLFSYEVDVILAPSSSPGAISVSLVTEPEERLLLVSNAGAASLVDGTNKFLFNNTPPVNLGFDAVVQYFVDTYGAERFAVFARNDDFGRTAIASIDESVKSRGGEIVLLENHTPGTSDFYALLTRAQALNADAFLVAAIMEDGVPFVRQARELGVTVPIAGPLIWSSAAFIAAAGEAMEGIYSYSNAVTSDTERLIAYRTAFAATMGASHQAQDATAFDLIHILMEAMRQVGSTTDTVAIRDALLNIEYEGILGMYRFNPRGQAYVQININTVRDGRVVVVQEFPPAF